MGNSVHFAQAQQSTTFKGKLMTGIELRYDRNRSRKVQEKISTWRDLNP